MSEVLSKDAEKAIEEVEKKESKVKGTVLLGDEEEIEDPTDQVYRGRNLLLLRETREWESVANLFELCRKKWKNNLVQFATSGTIEQIAIERIKWTAMVNGIETFFRFIQDDINEANRYDEKEKDIASRKEKRDKRRERRKVKTYNPYRDKQ